MIISTSTLSPLVNGGSIIRNIRSILEFCERPQMGICVLITDFEFAIRGVGRLCKLSQLKGPLGPVVSDEMIHQIQELVTFIIESDEKATWYIMMDKGISDRIIKTTSFKPNN